MFQKIRRRLGLKTFAERYAEAKQQATVGIMSAAELRKAGLRADTAMARISKAVAKVQRKPVP